MTFTSRFFVACMVMITPTLSYADEWSWGVTPYAWLTRVTFDTGVDQLSGGTVEFHDLLDNLDFAAQIHIEGHKNRLGLMLDVTNLQSSRRTTKGPFQIDTDSSVSLIEVGATLALSDEPKHLEVLVGLRSFIVDLELELETTGPIGISQRESEKETLVDAMIGLRYIWPLNDKWTFSARGDVATGDTDFSWNVAAIFGYQIGESGTLQFGYKHLDVGFDKMGNLDPEIALSGPAFGYTYSF